MPQSLKSPPPKSSHRRALMATHGGALTLIAGPEAGTDEPASLAQFLAIEKARERQRNAEAHKTHIRIG